MLRHTAGQKGKYIALSHRWDAGTESCKTTRNNVECRMGKCQSHTCTLCERHPFTLSQLFIDALILCANVDVRYIWIDSLSIVQDDALDWERESTRMAEYYQHAWLTVFATAITTDGGLFGPMAFDSRSRIARLPYRDEQHRHQGYFYLQHVVEGSFAGDYERDVSKSSLRRRGWVCQEWLLSRRCLTFSGAGGLFAECQRDQPHTLHGNQVNGNSEKVATDSAFRKSLNVTLSDQSHGLQPIFTAWLKVVEMYSGLEFTKLQKDRLVALSSLAREFGAVIERRLEVVSSAPYIAGLWWSSLDGLLWEQDGLPWERTRSRVKDLPSWSWASIAIPVRDVNWEVKQDSDGAEILSGLPVRWSDADDMTDVCRWGEQCLSIEVNAQTLEPNFETGTALVLPSTEPERFVSANRFVMIEMVGKLISVHVHGHFPLLADANIAANMTEHDLDFGRALWRSVTVAAKPDVIAGWASLEHPDYQTGATSTATLQVLVMKKKRALWGGYGNRGWNDSHMIYSVLFLKPADFPDMTDVFERVGCGRLFGGDVEDMFKQAEEQSIHLI